MSITSAQADAVRAQLDRLIASAAFKSSKRCQLLLTRIVEHSLSGDDATPLRERVLGVEVLGRKPNYDTADDPIVRVTAGEIRRRLGQYYGDPAHQGELRIDLPAGHYADPGARDRADDLFHVILADFLPDAGNLVLIQPEQYRALARVRSTVRRALRFIEGLLYRREL